MGIEPSAAVRESTGNVTDADRLPEEMKDMKIQDDKVCFCKKVSYDVSDAFMIFYFSLT